MDLLIGSTESASQFKAKAASLKVQKDGRPVEVVVAVTGWSCVADQCCQSSIVPNDVGPHSPIGQPEVAGSVSLRPVLQWQLTKTADNSFVKDILRITLHSTQKQS